jgi:uncharacterized protein YbjT (DUF2867 family)
MNDSLLTLVMGGRVGVGRLVLRELIARGLPVRASTRSLQGSATVAGVETIAADLTDAASLEPAFDGVAQVFLFAVVTGADAVLAAASAAGVKKIVLLSSGSVLVPSSATNPITVAHRYVEQTLTSADGPVLVPIRPLVLATNTLSWAHQIRATGTVRLYQPDAFSAPVHDADVAAVAAVALTAHSTVGGGGWNRAVSGLLTGPDRLSQREQVPAIGRAIGRDIVVVKQGRDEALGRMSQFMPAAEADAILMFLDDCAAGNSPATDTARIVLGRDPIKFSTWAVDHADDFR